jgi:ABC-type Fe3+ transport system substrate-binding protein
MPSQREASWRLRSFSYRKIKTPNLGGVAGYCMNHKAPSPSRYPAEVSFVGEVTRYNNTQNAVEIVDFRSNDEVQRDMVAPSSTFLSLLLFLYS